MSASNPLRTCREVSQSSIIFILAYKYKVGETGIGNCNSAPMIQNSLSNLYIPAILEIPERRIDQPPTVSRAGFLQVWHHTLYNRTVGAPKHRNMYLLHSYYKKKVSKLKCKITVLAATGLLLMYITY
jgi:hypothetical protein